MYAYNLLQIINNIKLFGQLSWDELKINQRSYYNLTNSAFWGWLSTESQPQNPEFRIDLENFHPCTPILNRRGELLLLQKLKINQKSYNNLPNSVFCGKVSLKILKTFWNSPMILHNYIRISSVYITNLAISSWNSLNKASLGSSLIFGLFLIFFALLAYLKLNQITS